MKVLNLLILGLQLFHYGHARINERMVIENNSTLNFGYFLDGSNETTKGSFVDGKSRQLKIAFGRKYKNLDDVSLCIQCKGKCVPGQKLLLKECNNKKIGQQWFFEKGKIMPQSNIDTCFTMRNDELSLRTCKKKHDGQQMFFISNADEFQIHLQSDTRLCLTHHKPKKNHKVHSDDCENAKQKKIDGSSYWDAGMYKKKKGDEDDS